MDGAALNTPPLATIEDLRELRRLPVRLVRETSRAGQRWTVFGLGLMLIAVATLFGIGVRHEPGGFSANWLIWVVIAGFGLVGLFLLYCGIQQTLALRTHETIVEMESPYIEGGAATRICIRQEGPVSLESLRVSLVCIERIDGRVQQTGKYGHTREIHRDSERQIFKQNILDERDIRIGRGVMWERMLEFTVPDKGRRRKRRTQGIVDKTWKIEVWGRVQWWADFMHPFVVDVKR
jgi:hypothetical protein